MRSNTPNIYGPRCLLGSEEGEEKVTKEEKEVRRKRRRRRRRMNESFNG